MTQPKRKYFVGCLCHAWCPNTTRVEDTREKSSRLWMCDPCKAGKCPHKVHGSYEFVPIAPVLP